MRHAPRDYAQSPMNIYWEMTQACSLACRHCRAEAIPTPQEGQLSFEEGVAFLRQIPRFGEPMPHLILTGGDPLERPDLYELIDEAHKLAISISITPAATPKLKKETLAKLKEHGVEGLGLSLDGPTAEHHDSIRGVPGTFDRTMEAIRWAQELQMPLQVNTLVSEETAPGIPAVYELLKPYTPARWSLFFLISVGRGKVLDPMTPEAGEELMRWIYQTAKDAPFIVATTEAPSYRRVALDQMRQDGLTGEEIRHSPSARGFGIRDGNGVVFVSNTGEICPAGFLPLSAGNVKQDSLVDVYQNAPIFQSLHDPNQFHGRCGECEYHALCGGSRARAFEATGDPLASDPFCQYEPHSAQHHSH